LHSSDTSASISQPPPSQRRGWRRPAPPPARSRCPGYFSRPQQLHPGCQPVRATRERGGGAHIARGPGQQVCFTRDYSLTWLCRSRERHESVARASAGRLSGSVIHAAVVSPATRPRPWLWASLLHDPRTLSSAAQRHRRHENSAAHRLDGVTCRHGRPFLQRHRGQRAHGDRRE
jgi:hypothetical protein